MTPPCRVECILIRVLQHAIPFSCRRCSYWSPEKGFEHKIWKMYKWHVLRLSARDVTCNWCLKRENRIKRDAYDGECFIFLNFKLTSFGIICDQVSLSDAINTHMIAIMRYIYMLISKHRGKQNEWMNRKQYSTRHFDQKWRRKKSIIRNSQQSVAQWIHFIFLCSNPFTVIQTMSTITTNRLGDYVI